MGDGALQIAFLAEGKLWVKRGAMAPQQVESAFAQGVLDRAAQNVERHGWRGRDESSPYGRMLWAQQKPRDETRLVRITALARAPRGEGADGAAHLLYALDTGSVGGLFTYDVTAGAENRLFHKQEFKAHDLACHPYKQVMALSTVLEDGTASIALMQPGTRKLHAVTEGDSLDQAPNWVPVAGEDGREVLVYQSAGLARNQRGFVSSIGPYAIHRLDVDKGQMSAVLEDPKWDYLVPRVRLEGGKERLYFIRRPYKSEGYKARTLGNLLLDIVLFPFRMARAIFAFFNAFSMFFTQKPLTTAGADPRKMDTRMMELHGKWIDTQKALAAAQKGQAVALVPASWELMCTDESGKMTSLATHVLSFDLAPDGEVVYTNGSEIFRLKPGEGVKAERVCGHRMVRQVMVFE